MGTPLLETAWLRWQRALALLVGVVILALAGCDEFDDMAQAEAPAASLSATLPADPPKASDTRHVSPSLAGRERYVDEPGTRPRMHVDEYVDTPKRHELLPADADEPPDSEDPERPPGARIYPQNVSDKAVPRVEGQPWMISQKWLRRHERHLQDPNRSRAQVVFIGDSIVEGWRMAPAYREYFAKYSPLDLGLSGDHTQHVLYRIEHGALADLDPKAVVVMVGVNNLAGGFTPEETVSGVRAVVGAIRRVLPNSRVLLLAVLPARQSPDDPLRQKIEETNRQLQGLEQAGAVIFHDAGAGLLETDGTISKTTLRDFIHPSAAGYEIVSKSVAPAIASIVGSPLGG